MSWSPDTGSLDIHTLHRHYRAGDLAPSDVVEAVYQRLEGRGEDHAWTSRVPRDMALCWARALEREGMDGKPLYGIPFGVKCNFDLAGFPTTMGCKAYARVAGHHHPLVQRLMDAGAIPMGKNNMDQFGVGLVGVRTDYGVPGCVFDARYVSGGSTSGGGVAVAAGMVSFALGGDAAGSGRVPAALNNIVGLKPTPGAIPFGTASPAGIVGSHSALTLTVADAVTVTRVMLGHDPGDPLSRPEAGSLVLEQRSAPPRFRFGVPAGEGLRCCGDRDAEALFRQAVARLEALGGEAVAVDMAAFFEAALLLYEGPFIAQRYANYGPFLEAHFEDIHPATREILCWGKQYSGADVFRGIHRINAIKQQVRGLFEDIDVLVTPTTPTTFQIAEVQDDNIRLNALLGTYTNFVNLLDMAGLAVPAGFRQDGLALGITLVGPAFQENLLCALGAAYQRACGLPLGATGNALPG